MRAKAALGLACTATLMLVAGFAATGAGHPTPTPVTRAAADEPAPTAHPVDADPRSAEWQSAFGELTSQLQEQFPDDYANRRINGDHQSGVIVFARAVPAEAAELVATMPQVTTEEGAGYTYAQRSASEGELYALVSEAFIDIEYLVSLDHATNTLQLSYDGTNPSATAGITALTEHSLHTVVVATRRRWRPRLTKAPRSRFKASRAAVPAADPRRRRHAARRLIAPSACRA